MRLNAEIKQEIYDEFSEMAHEEGRSISDVVRGLLNDWIAQKRREKIQLLKLNNRNHEEKDGKVVG